MIYDIYSIKDVVAGKFYDLMLFENEELAIRFFKQFASESKFAKDLQLFKVGEFDVKLGEIDNMDPYFVICGGDLHGES